MNTREIVLQQLAEIMEESSPVPFPDDVTDETWLDEFWLDSVAFVSLLTKLEDALGFIPKTVMEGKIQPKTVGDLITMYTTPNAEDT